MDEKNITINISTLTILKFLGIIAVVLFAYFIGDILLMVFIAIIFAALIEPPVSYLEKKKIPRALGIFLIYLILFLFLVLVIRLLIPPIAEQIGLFIQNFPGFWEQISQNYLSIKEYSQQQGLLDNVMSGLKGLQSGLQQAATGVYGFIIAIFENLVNFIMILVITFYLVVEKDVMDRVLRAIAPARYHDHLSQLFTAIQKKIGDWARGQLILGLIIGVLSFIGLIILLPKYALVLALVAGITELVPYIGPILGAIPAVFLGFAVPPVSFGRGLAVLILYIVIQQVENNIIVPQVMKKSVGLNPVIIIIVMLIGTRIAGIIGLILAIPAATVVWVIVSDFIKKSELAKLKDDLE
ncbi:MAG: AI-2E family transporter [Patescibacteria group bacterium]|jgi:predicted PurR-regulated permease PerM|nr:AI-2E family transporter [Patescibacteria group bacterium]